MTLWTPANLATLPTHWWDAQDSSTITISTGSSVSAWANTFVPLAQAGSASVDVYRVNGTNFNGPQTLYSNGTAVVVNTRGQASDLISPADQVFSMRNLPAFTGYSLFDTPNFTPNRPNGYIGEILLVPEAGLTQADDDLITGYLAWKWGLEGSLPADHPYKTAAPTVGPSANNATAASAFDLGGSSAAALAIAAQGASGLEITGAGSATVRIAATGAGSLPLGGSAQAASQAQASAAASGTLPLAGSAVTQVRITASASGALSLGGSAQASAAAIVAATATVTLPLGGAGTITARIVTTGAGTIDLGGASAVQVRIGAAGSGELPLAGAGAITTRIGAAGNGAIGLGGTSVAQAQIGAEAAGALPLTGTATAADRARVPSLIFAVPREDRIFFIAREQRIFRVAREQRIFKLKRAA